MGTHANIFVETGPNIFVGTYCHYDGYPDHMLPSLNEVSNDDLRGYILVAGLSGGMRFFNPPEEIETLAGHCRDEVLYLHNPVLNEESAHFIYIKQMDGVVRWRKAYSNNWQHEKLSILPLE
jgi:hypothetical protein